MLRLKFTGWTFPGSNIIETALTVVLAPIFLKETVGVIRWSVDWTDVIKTGSLKVDFKVRSISCIVANKSGWGMNSCFAGVTVN